VKEVYLTRTTCVARVLQTRVTCVARVLQTRTTCVARVLQTRVTSNEGPSDEGLTMLVLTTKF